MVPGASPHATWAWSTAWPVPSRSFCSTNVAPVSGATAARTSSAARPTTTTSRAPMAPAAPTGYARSGRPQRGWRTLGRAERMRLASPAARMMAVSWFMVSIVARGMPRESGHHAVGGARDGAPWPALRATARRGRGRISAGCRGDETGFAGSCPAEETRRSSGRRSRGA